jgi:putative flippase GtrA
MLYKKTSFIIVGSINTLFGYFFSIILYNIFYQHISLIMILAIGNFITISQAFITYKLFVFKTKNNWFSEYFRSYLVYGFSALLGNVITIIFFNIFLFPFWVAQGISIIFCALFSFFGHLYFTFTSRK